MSAVITVENLGKKYALRHQGRQESYLALRDVLTDGVRHLGRRLLGGAGERETREEFWALRDVSFQVEQGGRIGIIGRNGAGKSTLLKILSRITEPSTGRVRIRGRVASLLEVGTGFHPELTGRENIYLNGAILGMSRAEIRGKFDEIVAFAEIDRFLDTPVKRYSSGMYVRLAFAVAAHLEPEILIVDEVLAVGDGQFQAKCMGKMAEVGREGRTVLFVSHNLAAITTLCETCVLLENGVVRQTGTAKQVVDTYLNRSGQGHDASVAERTDRTGTGEARFVKCTISRASEDQLSSEFQTGDHLLVHLTVDSEIDARMYVGLKVRDVFGRTIASFNSRESGFQPMVRSGRNELLLQVPQLLLLEGRYLLDGALMSIGSKSYCDCIENLTSFSVFPNDFFGTGAPFNAYHGIVFLSHTWSSADSEMRAIISQK